MSTRWQGVTLKERLKPHIKTIALALLLIRNICGPSTALADPSETLDSRPNFLIFLTDDQRAGTLEKFMPKTHEFFKDGTVFKRGYVTTSISNPSRASILTGQLASIHGVTKNNTPLVGQSFAHHLKNAGYKTACIGKYLNTSDGSKPDEWDEWNSFSGGSHSYVNPRLNINGKAKRVKGYITDIFAAHAQKFLKQNALTNSPFVMYLAFNAPHDPAIPAEKDRKRWKNLSSHRPPNYNEKDRSDKPYWLQGIKLSHKKAAKVDKYRELHLRTLPAVDRAIDRTIKTLKKLNQLDNTVIFFLSDNGIFWGEHGLKSKIAIYEEASRVPFAVRYPSVFEQEINEDLLVANIDIAPTMYDLAGISVANLSGISLRKLVNGEVKREALLLEGFRDKGPRVPYRAIHTGDEVYVENENDLDEYYDLTTDPYQLTNFYTNPAYATRIATLDSMLDDLLADAAQVAEVNKLNLF